MNGDFEVMVEGAIVSFFNKRNVPAEWLSVLLRIREVPGSNFTRRAANLTESFPGFPQPFQPNADIIS
jgi:hypothetical protein